MRLYFFRHGIAQERDGQIQDHMRQLTREGVANTHRATRVIKALGIEPDRLFSSPLIRARETANILGAALSVAVQVRQEVGPGFDVAAIERLTVDLGEDAEVMFVGHEPDFSDTLEDLTGGRIEVKKGSLICVTVINYNPIHGELSYALSPKIFKRLGLG